MSPDSGNDAEFHDSDEATRLDAFRGYCIVDSDNDPALDAITSSAARIFNAPIALISLVDADRQFFKSRHGLNICETTREDSFCNELLKSKQPLVVEDAAQDDRFRNNIYVEGEPHVRFYAGAPLVDPTGQVLGSFCIIDCKVRPALQPHEMDVLQALAGQVVEIITANYPVMGRTIDAALPVSQLFRSFVRGVPLAAAMIDRDMKYLAVSDRWYKVFGFKEDNLIGMNHLDFFPDIEDDRREFFHKSVNEGAIEVGNEMLCQKFDGTPIWLRCDSQPWYNTDGTIGGMLLYRRQIDDEILARTEAGKTQHLFETFFYHNPTQMYVKTPDGKYQLYNKAFAATYKLPPNPENLRTSDIFPADAAEQMEIRDAEVLASGKSMHVHQDIVVNGEIQQRLEVIKFPVLNDKGEVWAVGGVSVDITQNYRLEEAVRQAQKMEAVGSLTGGIAHDFNNILAVILGNLQLLERRLEKNSKEEERLTGALNATLRGASLTRQLLAFSRRQELEPSVIDVNSTLNEFHKMISRTLSEDIEIEVNFKNELPNAYIDEGQLQNSVLNLAINARDAMPDGGKLFIETGEVRISDDELSGLDGLSPGHYVIVSITDTGSGMTKDVKSRVFEPFFTTKGVGKGTGLGLAMVYGFIKQSEGHVAVYSEINHGTTIRLYLPVATGETSETDDAPVLTKADAAGRILVVEDDDAVRAIVQAMLEDLGYDLAEAASGAEALEILEAGERFDLVFSDVIMPGGMTGVDLARVVAQRYPEIPVLLTSGYPRDAVKADVPVHILPKPYQQQQLAEEIARAIAGNEGDTA